MKTHLKHKFQSVRQYTPHVTLGDIVLHCMRAACYWWKKCLQTRYTRILTDFASKRNRKDILTNFNETRINIDRQHDR